MICKSCKNKSICKHYQYLKDIDINITIQITACELYSNSNSNNNVAPSLRPDPLFRQPLPSTYVEEEEDIEEEEGEKVFINLDDYREPQNISIAEMLLKGDLKHD